MTAVALKSYLFPVRPDEIDQFWPKIRHLIEKPLVRTKADRDFSPEDIREAIREGLMQCWIAHDGGTILVVAVTEILCYPRRKVLGIPFVGAETGSLDQWIDHMEAMKVYARENGCKAVRVWGRAGWVKVLNPDVTRLEADIEV